MKKKIIPVLVAIVLICVVALVEIVPKILDRYAYSKERMALTDYFDCSGYEARIMLQDDFLEERALIREGAVYFDYDTVEKYIEDRFYYNDMERTIKYTLPDQVETVSLSGNRAEVMITVPGTEGTQTLESETLAHAAVLEEEGTLYLLADYVQRYCNMSFTLYGDIDTYRVQVFTMEDTVSLAQASDATSVRKLGGIKSPILTDLARGEELVVLNRMDRWAKVKTTDCIIGYIETKYLENEQTVTRKKLTDLVEPVYPRITRDHKIVMGWHQVMSRDANSTLGEVTANAHALNVISPTWFRLKGKGDDITFENLATADYVQRAHNAGLEVWALVEDIEYENDLYATFSSTASRERLETMLVSAALEAGVDGINIDFEGVSRECGPHFVQFLRELSIITHANGLVLSVDNYVPEGGRNQYNLKEQGIVVDYVVLMGYDEHWGPDSGAGSVASIGFVERGINDTIKKGVSADKIINGVPFYTRIWSTKGAEVKCSAVGMQAANDWVNQYGIKLEWDEAACQYYGEITSSGTLYQVWMEDAESIQVKMNVMNSYGVAGVSVWRLGYETRNIWDLFAAYGMS